MYRYLILFSVIVFAPVIAAEEHYLPVCETLETEVMKLLESNIPRDQAWGAYYAGKYGVGKAGSVIFDLIERAPELTGHEKYIWNRAMTLALLELRPLLEENSCNILMKHQMYGAAIALMPEKPKAFKDQLLKIRKETTDTRIWVASTNLLLQIGSEECVNEMYSKLKFTFTVEVKDPESFIQRFRGRRIGGGFGHTSVIPEKWPVIVPFAWTFEPRKDSFLLSNGPVPVYGYQAARGSIAPFSKEMYRLKSMLWIAGIDPVDFHLTRKNVITVDYTEDTDVKKEVLGKMQFLMKDLEKLTDRIKSKNGGYLRMGVQKPDIHVEVEDHRADKTKQLPKADEFELELNKPKEERTKKVDQIF